MEVLFKLRKFYELKKIYRFAKVDKRKESSAEHSWSSLILADYFLNNTRKKIDRLKVYELIMYHDVVEIESGDFPVKPKIKFNNQQEIEIKAAKKLKEKFPKILGDKFYKLFKEFLEQKTVEAKFAKAVEQLDAEIHELDYKKDYKGWTEEFLRSKKQKYFDNFPELREAFEKIVKYLKKNNYFNQ